MTLEDDYSLAKDWIHGSVENAVTEFRAWLQSFSGQADRVLQCAG